MHGVCASDKCMSGSRVTTTHIPVNLCKICMNDMCVVCEWWQLVREWQLGEWQLVVLGARRSSHVAAGVWVVAAGA